MELLICKILILLLSKTIQVPRRCEEPATITRQTAYRNPGYMHTIILSQLKPNTRYYYRYGNAISGWSSISSFRSPPKPGHAVNRFLAYGGTTSLYFQFFFLHL